MDAFSVSSSTIPPKITYNSSTGLEHGYQSAFVPLTHLAHGASTTFVPEACTPHCDKCGLWQVELDMRPIYDLGHAQKTQAQTWIGGGDPGPRTKATGTRGTIGDNTHKQEICTSSHPKWQKSQV
ncbi:Hypothetical predicted protein [Pelobates cultripes]|uniref:Uncharacterized protein n=1 Tax=Pelobates cultripes TaxID=61616 RepID=A0AAD1SDK9_PELCU|nr:Hypothetical predicted protein [Pelobates cultripes]